MVLPRVKLVLANGDDMDERMDWQLTDGIRLRPQPAGL
jgi:hypothetical protein